MLILKRILSSLINVLLFIIVILIIYPLFNYFKIEVDDNFFLLLIFCIVFFLPLLSLKTTFGLKLLGLEVNSSSKMILKYFTYYILLLGILFRVLTLIFRIDTLSLLPVYSIIALSIINYAMFFISSGRYNLLDYILKIVHSNFVFKRGYRFIFLIWFTFWFLIALVSILADRLHVKSYLNSYVRNESPFSLTGYYPKDTFNNYTYWQIEKFEENNTIFTFSDSLCIFQDRFLKQKKIIASINKETFENENRRYILCYLLIHYSEINDSINNVYSQIDQTKIVLVHSEPYTYFGNKVVTYTYYYDNKNPKESIYGGIRLDSLLSYYKRQLTFCEEYRIQTVANIHHIDDLQIKKIIQNGGKLSFSKEEDSILANKRVALEPLLVRTIPFGDVKPEGIIWINFPHGESSVVETDRLFDTNKKKSEVMYYRNALYYFFGGKVSISPQNQSPSSLYQSQPVQQ